MDNLRKSIAIPPQQYALRVEIDPFENPKWAPWHDTLEAFPRDLPESGATGLHTIDPAAEELRSVAIVHESRPTIESDRDFLNSIVKGIRDDVLSGTLDESWPETAAAERTVPQGPQRTETRQRTLAPVQQSLRASRLRTLRSSIRPMYRHWADMAIATGAAVTATTARAARRLSPSAWITATRYRSSRFTATGGLIVASLAIAIGAWFLFSGLRPQPTVATDMALRQDQSRAANPAAAGTPGFLARPVRATVRVWWGNVRELLVKLGPSSSTAVASTPSTIASGSQSSTPVQMAAAARGRPPSAVSARARSTVSITRQPSVVAPPANGGEASVPPVSVSGSNRIDKAPEGVPNPIGPAAAPSVEIVRGPAEFPVAAPASPSLMYDAGNADVTPPTAASTPLLGGWSPSSPIDGVDLVVVVNVAGTVDTVRGANAPRTMAEALLLTSALSIVKSWRFRPALKDGVPVKYRLIVPLRMLTRP